MDILTTIRAARDSFNYWFPMLLPAEQERLLGIIQGMPQHVAIDMLIYNERFCMDLQNVRGIHTCGPNGGGEQPLVSNLTPPGTEPAKQG
jgi:hypothetical protein